MRSIDVAASGICAALYAGIGYLTYLGIFTPVIGVVRFWPAVIIPGIFSVIFGPLVAAIGAAIGIFISDMLIHGNALLSITVGVPANFIAFYIMGKIAKYKLSASRSIASTGLYSVTLLAIDLALHYNGFINEEVSMIFIATIVITFILLVVMSQIYKEWISYCIASYIGLLVGSAIIGIGVWGFSQLFVLPSGDVNLPLVAAVIWFIWVFSTEIPFLIILGPPILRLIYRVMPYLTEISH